MTRIFVSIVETSLEKTIEAVRRIDDDRLGIEVRVDSFDPNGERAFPAAAIRSVSNRPMIYTRRSGDGRSPATVDELRGALEAGFDFVDVELDDGPALDQLPLESVILSHHDFQAVPDLAELIGRMERTGAARLKIAVRPRSFEEDLAILEQLVAYEGPADLTLFGMGSYGLYSRTLAPFFGSRISFVAIDDDRLAAPGQLTVARGLEIWGGLDDQSRPAALYAVVGSPVSHSQSPRIHNAKFRADSVPAAYGMIETTTIEPVLDAMESGSPAAPRGLSVTAPLKTMLLEQANRRGWSVTERARKAGSANTVVESSGGFVVDNTDVLGFAAALADLPPNARVAILGAGGTARAAVVAAAGAGSRITILNRTVSRAETLAAEIGGEARSLGDAGTDPYDVVIDTLPRSASRGLTLPPIAENGLLVRAAYDIADAMNDSAGPGPFRIFGPIDLLEAQAEEQSRRFIASAGEKS